MYAVSTTYRGGVWWSSVRVAPVIAASPVTGQSILVGSGRPSLADDRKPARCPGTGRRPHPGEGALRAPPFRLWCPEKRSSCPVFHEYLAPVIHISTAEKCRH